MTHPQPTRAGQSGRRQRHGTQRYGRPRQRCPLWTVVDVTLYVFLLNSSIGDGSECSVLLVQLHQHRFGASSHNVELHRYSRNIFMKFFQKKRLKNKKFPRPGSLPLLGSMEAHGSPLLHRVLYGPSHLKSMQRVLDAHGHIAAEQNMRHRRTALRTQHLMFARRVLWRSWLAFPYYLTTAKIISQIQ